jgi:DNA-binding transcriptional ArsR family regulator
MEMTDAQNSFQALGQTARLTALRLLVRSGPDGLPAGDISRALDVRQSTLSAQLAQLQGAGLIRSARAGRSIRYSADMVALRALIAWLVDDCCGGDPNHCAPVGNRMASPSEDPS